MGHKLQKNKGSRYPNRIIFYDTETYEVDAGEWTEHHLWFGYGLYWERNKNKKDRFDSIYFKDIEVFWQWLTSKVYNKTKLWLISHNQDFDFRVMRGFEQMKKIGYDLDYSIIASPPFLVQFSKSSKDKKGKKTILVQDTTNYFMRSLDSIGETLGISKLKYPFQGCKQGYCYRYCKRDVDILYKLFTKFISYLDKNDMGNLGKTVASQSLNTYRHRFMQHDIYIHDDEGVRELESDGYYGGRTECFKIFQDDTNDYYYIDINSMYPYVMKQFKYPYRYRFQVQNIDPQEFKDFIDKHYYIAQVKVKTEKRCIPKKIDGRLCFPVGEFWTTLCTPEIVLAMKEGKIQEVGKVAVYDKADIFSKYVTTMYDKRIKFESNDDNDFALMTKILLNSLYGKFGQMSPNWEKSDRFVGINNGVYEVYNGNIDDIETFRVIEGQTFKLEGKEPSNHTFIAIPAHVTSFARMLMWESMQIVGRKNFYYCDTDSLIINEQGYKNIKHLVDDTKLGYWDMEKKINRLSIRGLKDYTVNDDTKLKGIPEDKQKDGKRQYKITMWEHTRGNLRRGKITVPRTRPMKKVISQKYEKGTIEKNGWIKPIKL